jgi:hypothetical protein
MLLVIYKSFIDLMGNSLLNFFIIQASFIYMKVKDVTITHHSTAKAAADRIAAIKAVTADMSEQDNPDCRIMIYKAREAEHTLVEVWSYPDLAAKSRCLDKWQHTSACPPEHSQMDAARLELADDIVWHD